MTGQVFVTADLVGRTRRPEVALTPGVRVIGDVVIASPEALRGLAQSDVLRAAVVVVGGGPVPEGLRPFLRLPAECTSEELETAIDASLTVMRLEAQLRDTTRSAVVARERQLDLAKVGIALTQERNLDRLLELILTTARELVGADAGSLYLIETHDEQRLLRFILAQNDSVPVHLSSFLMAVNQSSFAGYVAQTGEAVTVADVRQLPPDVPYRFNDSIDEASSYYTRSQLTAPIATRAGEVIGVLQLLNRKTEPTAAITDSRAADDWVVPFGDGEIAVIRALAAQAAVAIENTRLVKEIEQLFESFVHASVTAIEQRDPTTSGHSLRVAHFTVGLAQAVEQAPPPSYRDMRFSPDQITQIRYAGLLHDFGKVGVREAVLTKSTKLFPERLATVRERFAHARRAREVELMRRMLRALAESGKAPGQADLEALEAALAGVRAELDTLWSAVQQANQPAVLPTETRHLLADAEAVSFPGLDEQPELLLLPEEVAALSVPKGSLNETERLEIESHVSHSYQFLLTIPWPKRFRRVPDIVLGHHEKLNGSGYPHRLQCDQIPPEVRMMTVCDIYDALAAQDRPYKRAVSPERALDILRDEVRAGFLDGELLQVFIDAHVYERIAPGLRP